MVHGLTFVRGGHGGFKPESPIRTILGVAPLGTSSHPHFVRSLEHGEMGVEEGPMLPYRESQSQLLWPGWCVQVGADVM